MLDDCGGRGNGERDAEGLPSAGQEQGGEFQLNCFTGK